MADGPSRGGFSDGKGKGKGDGKGKGKGGGRGRGRGGRGRDEEKAGWVPCTKLGRLVQAGKITSLEEVFLFSLPVKEPEIIDHFLPSAGGRDGPGVAGGVLTDQVMKIMPVQKQTTAGQRTRFKAFVAVGDCNGHIGLGVKCAKEVATSIRGAIMHAKLCIVPVRRGYWGGTHGLPHTVPTKITGKCGSVRIRLVPAPRGSGLVAAPVTKKLLGMAGIKDCYTSASGHTRTQGNFVKAAFFALRKTYGYLEPNFWEDKPYEVSPYQSHTDFLSKSVKAY